MLFSDLPPEEEMQWEAVPIIGLALRMRVYLDSNGDMIRPKDYYQVGLHTKTGKFIIVSEGIMLELIKQRALSKVMNDQFRQDNRFN